MISNIGNFTKKKCPTQITVYYSKTDDTFVNLHFLTNQPKILYKLLYNK